MAYTSMNLNGTRIVISGSGELTINGRAPELEGGSTSTLNAYSKILKDFHAGSFLITEGCATRFGEANKEFKASIGGFNIKQQERAWIAFRERIVPANLEATQFPSVVLKQVSEKLLTFYQKNVELSNDPVNVLVDAERILKVVHDVFIDQVRKSRDGMLIIKGSVFDEPLDKILIDITGVFLKILNDSQKSGDIEKIKNSLSGLSSTRIGQKFIWSFLGDLVVNGKTSEAVNNLIFFAPTLLNQIGSERLANLFWKHLSVDERASLTIQLEQINNSYVPDILHSYWALCAIKEENLEIALRYATEIKKSGSNSETLVAIANAIWCAKKFGEAREVVSKILDTEKRDEWYILKSYELWTMGKFSDAKDLIQKLNDYSKRDKWYLEKSNDLWDRGNHSEAKDFIQKLNDYEKRDHWYKSKADELWDKGSKSDARDLIQKLNDYTKRDKWYSKRADEFWTAGNKSEARDLIQKLNNYEKRDHWYKSKADELWDKGDKSDAKDLIRKLNDYEKRDTWLREKGIS